MPSGLELYNDDGSLMLGVTTYVGSFIGSFSTGGNATGTHTDTKLIGRTLLSFLPDTGTNTGRGGPVLSLNSTTGVISWSYSYSTTGGASAPSIPNDTIFYGGY